SYVFFFQAEDGIRDFHVTGVQTCALPIFGIEQPLRAADAIMNEHRIRHLPVLHGGALRGVLTDRDLRLVESFPDVDLDRMTVEEAMTAEPFAVSPDAPLDEVTSEMAEKRYGCAVVVQNHNVVGIFTTVDACQALTD